MTSAANKLAVRDRVPTTQSDIEHAYAEYQRAFGRLWTLLAPQQAEIHAAQQEWQLTMAVDGGAGPTDQEVATLIYERRERSLRAARNGRVQ